MQQTFDAVVVGSGATGGWVAQQLTEAGLQVAVLEAGRRLNPAEDYTEHTLPHQMPLRGRRLAARDLQARQPVQTRCYQCDEYANHLFIDDAEHPYTTPADRRFDWIRGRHVGGKSILWARQSYRLSDYDFKAASRDRFGDDWPLSYEEMAPYYDRVERFVGISGQAEGLPQLPDSRFLPPMDLTCGEEILKKAIGDRAHRQRRGHVGAQPLAAGARCEQPVRDGRVVLRLVRLPESDADHDGARRPRQRLPGRGIPRQPHLIPAWGCAPNPRRTLAGTP